MEKTPVDYLKVLPIWISFRNIPVNNMTADTIKEISEHTGQVTHVTFDPLKPQSRGCKGKSAFRHQHTFEEY